MTGRLLFRAPREPRTGSKSGSREHLRALCARNSGRPPAATVQYRPHHSNRNHRPPFQTFKFQTTGRCPSSPLAGPELAETLRANKSKAVSAKRAVSARTRRNKSNQIKASFAPLPVGLRWAHLSSPERLSNLLIYWPIVRLASAVCFRAQSSRPELSAGLVA